MIQVNPKTCRKFKSFNETFPYCAFAMALSMLYPNRDNIRTRCQIIAAALTLNGLLFYWFVTYIWKCLYNNDMFNVSRNISVGILIILLIFKSYYAIKKTDKFGQLLDKINQDLLKGNDMDIEYQEIYEHYIKLGKLGQICWIFIPIFLSSQFAFYAVASNIYDSLTSDVGKRYMIQEIEIKHLEDKQYDSPYYELIFATQLFLCMTISPNFAGYDGSFCIASNHLRLKLKILAQKVKSAFKESKSRQELQINIKKSIIYHQEALEFYNNLQDVYGVWLLAVFLVTSIVISLNIYQIVVGESIDPKYATFAISGVIHMFTPCYFASNLMMTSEQLCWDLYSAEWEKWTDPAVTKLLIFMIAKSQQTLILTGNGLVYFNMQLFISMMQTSYSLFTLISS